MKRKLFSLLLLLVAYVQFSFCQKKIDDIDGKWQGTSICQVKNSPCHDENVVYHISKAGNDSTYAIQANKIVNGVEEDMGTLNGVYDKTMKLLSCHYENKCGQKSLWEFNINGDQIKGRLLMEKDNTVYRIEVKKIK